MGAKIFKREDMKFEQMDGLLSTIYAANFIKPIKDILPVAGGISRILPGKIEFTFPGYSEVCYVIDGEIKFTIDGKTYVANTGDCYMVEAGTKVTIECESTSTQFFVSYPAEALEKLFKGE